MMRTAHDTLLARLDKHGAFGIADLEAEEYLIANGYTRYTQRPLMLLAARGVEYARRHARWAENRGRTQAIHRARKEKRKAVLDDLRRV